MIASTQPYFKDCKTYSLSPKRDFKLNKLLSALTVYDQVIEK